MYKFSMEPISEKQIDSITKKNASQNAKMNDFKIGRAHV